MSEEDNNEQEMDALAEAFRKKMRGANDYWFWRDKPEMEIGAVQEVLSKVGVRVQKLRPGTNPPDCEGLLQGKRTGIEVTELVHRPTLEKSIKGEHQYFLWDRESLLTELELIIERKDNPRNLKDGPYEHYILVIITDEFVLGYHDVSQYLEGAIFRCKMITDAYLGLSYDPTHEGGSCPVFKLSLSRI